MSCKKWRIIANCVEVAGALALLVAFCVHRGWNAVSIFGLILMLAGVGVHAVKFRCPSCGRHISDRVPYDITHCPYCGAELVPLKTKTDKKS